MSSISLTLSLRGRLLSGYQTTLQGALFGNNEPGVTFEPWDITTLYQDRAGTTPVTAAGQSVGLRLSKDQGLRIGAELVTNGDFATDTVWSKGVGWTIGSGVASANIATGSNLDQSLTTSINKTYRITFTVTSYTSGGVRARLTGSANINGSVRSAVGTYSEIFIATATNSVFRMTDGGTGFVGSIDDISVREIAGNHEVAINDAARGIYGWMPKTGRRNLLALGGTTLLNNSDGGATIDNAPTGFTPPIDASFQRVTKLAVATQFYAYRTSQVGASTGQTVMSCYVLPDAGCTEIGFHTDTNAQGRMRYNLTTGVTTLGPNTAAAGAVALGGGWYRIWAKTLGVAASMTWVVVANTATTGAAASFVVGGHQSEAATLTAFQKTVSNYDITEAGVPSCYYVLANGVNTAYVTPTITPGTDKVQVFAGVRKLSATTGVFFELGPNSNTNDGVTAFYFSETGNTQTFVSKGQNLVLVQHGISSPYNAIMTGLGDISGDTATLRVNGTQVAQLTSNQGTGNYLSYPAYLYARGGTTLPFNGYDFGHVERFGPNLDAATIARVESLLARNTPEVTL